jgi:hypothetical protein
MINALFWLYLINSVLLINHEIDSAYWNEWRLFRLRGGITVFLIIHFPLLFIILYGLVEVYKQSFTGLVLSVILSAGGIFAFSIHSYFIRKGNPEFSLPLSRLILIATLMVSLAQMAVTVYIMSG